MARGAAVTPGRDQRKSLSGKQEGELHKRLLLTLQALCERSTGFSEVGIPNATLFGMPGTGHRFPDLQARYNSKNLVFELQISKTYLPVISDREHFYRQNGIFLFWLFHNFDLWKGRQTERDIVAMRSRQAFELNDEAIRATLECGNLTIKAHWQVPEHDGKALTWRWVSKLIKFEELTFDEYLIEALAANPWRDEAELLAKTHAPLITKFEAYWIDRWEWTRKLSREAHQRFLDGLPVDKTRLADAVMRRGFESVLTASGMLSDMAERIYDLNFNDLLDRLFFLRDGINKLNKQNIAGAMDTVLQHWPHYTDTLVAVAAAYGHMETLRRPNVLRKLRTI